MGQGSEESVVVVSYFLIRNKMKTPALSLHSFRHTAAAKLELARTHGSTMRRLLGHSIGTDTENRMYKRSLQHDVKELQEALEGIRYPSPLGQRMSII